MTKRPVFAWGSSAVYSGSSGLNPRLSPHRQNLHGATPKQRIEVDDFGSEGDPLPLPRDQPPSSSPTAGSTGQAQATGINIRSGRSRRIAGQEQALR